MARYSRRLRKVAVAAAVLATLVETTGASSHLKLTPAEDHQAHRRHEEIHAKRATNYFDFLGAQGGVVASTGQVPQRREINTFVQDATAMNLFVLALDRMMSTKQTNASSYYQVAGIHGRPYTAWDGVTGQGGNTNAGYCTHADILFPSWHRPYMALYEQILWTHANNIAREFSKTSPQYKKYTAAAPGWRMPYWDWAQNANVPDICNQPTVTVEKPAGTTSIPNPLYAYKFNPLNTNDLPDFPYNYMSQTYRNPAQSGNSFVNQPDDLNNQLQNIATNLRSRVYTLLTAYTSYGSFSNKATTTAVNGQYDSLESIHDTIHGTVGGNGGHMGAVDYAAFDPLFFLHHTNIDRIFALWQAINPNAYAISSSANRANFFMAAGTSETGSTPLLPFHQTDSTYYTSNSAAKVKSFGYTYPELVDWTSGSVLSSSALRSSVIGQINQLYGDSQPANILSSASASFTPTTAASSTVVPTTVVSTKAGKATTITSSVTTAAAATAPAADTDGDWSAWNNWMFNTAAKVKRDFGNPLNYRAATVPAATTSSNVATGSTDDSGSGSGSGLGSASASMSGTSAAGSASGSGLGSGSGSVSNTAATASGPGSKSRPGSGPLSKTSASAPGPTSSSGSGSGSGSGSKTASAVPAFKSGAMNAPKYKAGKTVDEPPPVSAVAPWTPALIKGNAYQDYVVNVAVDNAALNGTFSVFFFLGQYDSDATTWATSPNLVGVHSVFAPTSGGHSVLVSGSIPLTASLINRVIAGDLASLNVTSVSPFLAANLSWKVKKLNDQTVYSGDVSAMKVQVNTALVQMPQSSTSLPIYGPYTTLYNVTDTKPAGISKGETLH